MITIEKCAAILNRNGRYYSHEEIKQIRETLYYWSRLDATIRRHYEN